MKTKRFIAALMAFVVLFSLCGCGGKGSKGEADAEKNNSGNAVAGYVDIEANNDEGRIIAAADRTLFGSSGLSFVAKDDGYTVFDGSISFSDLLSMSGLYLEVDDSEIRLAADNGKVYLLSDDYEEYYIIDIAKILAPSSGEFDALVTGLTDRSVNEWVQMLSQMGIDVDFKKVTGWVNRLVNGSINEDVIAEIFDTVAIPYFVYMLNSEGVEINESDIPDFKTLKGIIYDFFLDGHASSGLDIDNDGDEYEVTVYIKAIVESALEYIESHEKLQKLVNSEIGQYFLREVREEFDYVDEDESFDFTVEITDGYISYVEFYGIEVKISDFSNVDVKEDYDALVEDADGYELVGEINSISDVIEVM